ncbi:MAG: hypothetical protein Q8R39_01300 [bacterium]|nr:hypothetical protein [bacterium]MDZ4284718.1 hypothetical protein [Patescibacteria group bacterium]
MQTLQTEHFRLALIEEWRDYFSQTTAVSHEPCWHSVPISTLAEFWLRYATKVNKELLRLDVLPPGHLVLHIGIRVSVIGPLLSKCALALRLDTKEEQAAIKALYEETICLLQYRKQALLLDINSKLSLAELARNYDRW